MFVSSSRMTASELAPSKQDSTAKDVEKGGDLTEGVAGKDSHVLHETRSQKQASKKRLHEDHAETTKDSSFPLTSETANNSVGVATRSSTRPSKRPKLSTSTNNRVGNQGMCTKITIYFLHKRHTSDSDETAILSCMRISNKDRFLSILRCHRK